MKLEHLKKQMLQANAQQLSGWLILLPLYAVPYFHKYLNIIYSTMKSYYLKKNLSTLNRSGGGEREREKGGRHRDRDRVVNKLAQRTTLVPILLIGLKSTRYANLIKRHTKLGIASWTGIHSGAWVPSLHCLVLCVAGRNTRVQKSPRDCMAEQTALFFG